MPSTVTAKFTDPYDFQRAIRAATVEAVVTKPGIYSAELTRTDLHQLWMQRGRMSLPHVARSALHNDRRAVFFPTQGTMHHSGMEILLGEIVFLSSGAEHHYQTPAEFGWGAMSLTPDALAAAGRTLAGYELIAPSRTRVIRPPPHLMARLLHLHEAVGHLATAVPDILGHTDVARAMEQELVRTMIACLSVGTVRKTHNFGYQRVPVMVRFEQVLEANRGKSLYVAEICAAIGVSDRTLRVHCQENLGMGPHRYLWLRGCILRDASLLWLIRQQRPSLPLPTTSASGNLAVLPCHTGSSSARCLRPPCGVPTIARGAGTPMQTSGKAKNSHWIGRLVSILEKEPWGMSGNPKRTVIAVASIYTPERPAAAWPPGSRLTLDAADADRLIRNGLARDPAAAAIEVDEVMPQRGEVTAATGQPARTREGHERSDD